MTNWKSDKPVPKHFRYSLLWFCTLCFPEIASSEQCAECSRFYTTGGAPGKTQHRAQGKEPPQIHTQVLIAELGGSDAIFEVEITSHKLSNHLWYLAASMSAPLNSIAYLFRIPVFSMPFPGNPKLRGHGKRHFCQPCLQPFPSFLTIFLHTEGVLHMGGNALLHDYFVGALHGVRGEREGQFYKADLQFHSLPLVYTVPLWILQVRITLSHKAASYVHKQGSLVQDARRDRAVECSGNIHPG